MKSTRQKQEQTFSVFDRLLDFDPDKLSDEPLGATTKLRRAKDAIRRDLEILLNTQQPLGSVDRLLPELENSLLRYGTPGFHGLMLATREQRLGLAHSIQELIGLYEPRLSKVTVGLGDEKSDNNRMLHLRIKANFVFDKTEEAVVFDTTLDPAIRQFKIENMSS